MVLVIILYVSKRVLLLNTEKQGDSLVIIWVYQTAEKKLYYEIIDFLLHYNEKFPILSKQLEEQLEDMSLQKRKVLANNPSAELKLLKENHKKDKLIELLETELYGNSNPSK